MEGGRERKGMKEGLSADAGETEISELFKGTLVRNNEKGAHLIQFLNHLASTCDRISDNSKETFQNFENACSLRSKEHQEVLQGLHRACKQTSEVSQVDAARLRERLASHAASREGTPGAQPPSQPPSTLGDSTPSFRRAMTASPRPTRAITTPSQNRQGPLGEGAPRAGMERGFGADRPPGLTTPGGRPPLPSQHSFSTPNQPNSKDPGASPYTPYTVTRSSSMQPNPRMLVDSPFTPLRSPLDPILSPIDASLASQGPQDPTSSRNTSSASPQAPPKRTASAGSLLGPSALAASPAAPSPIIPDPFGTPSRRPAADGVAIGLSPEEDKGPRDPDDVGNPAPPGVSGGQTNWGPSDQELREALDTVVGLGLQPHETVELVLEEPRLLAQYRMQKKWADGGFVVVQQRMLALLDTL